MLLFVIELRPTCNVTGEMGAWQESHGRHKARACAPDRGHGDGCGKCDGGCVVDGEREADG